MKVNRYGQRHEGAVRMRRKQPPTQTKRVIPCSRNARAVPPGVSIRTRIWPWSPLNVRSVIENAAPASDCGESTMDRYRQSLQRTRCPVCQGVLRLVVGHGVSERHFVHCTAEDANRCPLSTTLWQPDGFTVRQKRDPRTSDIHFARFVENWRRHYGLMKRLVPVLNIQRFICLVEYANVLNLWSHAGLREADIPYVLLALAEFIRQPPGPEGYTTWVRFCFESDVRDLKDLWMSSGAGQARLFRMVYLEPVLTPFPVAAQMIDWETVRRDEGFLTGSSPYMCVADVRAFERFLAALRERGAAEHGA